MEIYLIDPKKKWCKANLHNHTVNSDGYFTPLEIKEIYKKNGYSIVAFSDHDLIFDSSYLTDNEFVAITSCEYTIGKNDIDSKINDSTNWRNHQVIHLNIYAKDPHNVMHVACKEDFNETFIDKYKPNEILYDGYKREYSQKSIQEIIDRYNKLGFLVQFNHPNWSLCDREDYIHLKGLWSLEILNYATEIETGMEYGINIYEDFLRNGTKLFCTMGDDNHNPDGSLSTSFGAFNYIGVNKLTYDDVIKAMENGNIYTSSGPIIYSLIFNNETREIVVECSEAQNIILTGYKRRFQNAFKENITKATFKLYDDEVYFRITIKDKFGHVAHTHAYFLNDYEF